MSHVQRFLFGLTMLPFNLQGKLASWNCAMGFGQSLPFTVIVLALLYCSMSCYGTAKKKYLLQPCAMYRGMAMVSVDCATQHVQGEHMPTWLHNRMVPVNYLPQSYGKHLGAVDRSFSQILGVHPDSSVSSSAVHQDCQTCRLLLLHHHHLHGCHQNVEDRYHSCNANVTIERLDSTRPFQAFPIT